MTDTEVLIVGAGPTGLVLALFLTKRGVRVRLIDTTTGPGTTSRAIVMHARNLEFYRQVGIADTAVREGSKFSSLTLWVNGRQRAHVDVAESGAGLSRFPFMLILPQDAQERLLIEQLVQCGVHVERQTELVSFEELDGRVHAQLRLPDGTLQPCAARYLAGCDGAHSTVRRELGMEFAGGEYSDVFYVADIVGEGPPMNGETNIALDDANFLVIFPMKGAGAGRLVGAVRREGAAPNAIRWEDVSQRVADHLRLKVTEVRWFSTYHVHHRVAATFRRGPVFLLGDAAHIHSPVGGQGMNTGIGDAVNLAWKVAGVLQGRIDESVLDTYSPERIAFARRLVNSTDKAFEFVSARGPIATRVRLALIPFLLPKLFAFRAMRRLMFRTLSQTAIRYPESALSAGKAGDVNGGDRLPWVELGGDGTPADNYEPLGALEWQLHCYGEVTPAVRELCERRGLECHSFPWRGAMRRAGFRRDAIYLVRPDGHVGLADSGADAGILDRYCDEQGIRYSPPTNGTRPVIVSR